MSDIRKFHEWRDASFIFLNRASLASGEQVDVDDDRLVHDLVWAESGYLLLLVDERCLVVTANLAAWIPAGVRYQVLTHRRSDATVLSFWPDYCPRPHVQTTTVARTGITRDVSHYLAQAPGNDEARYHAERLLLASLGDARATPDLPMPTDDRARRVAERLLADPAEDRTLRAWGLEVGASARTLARAFGDSTGMTFPAWRTAMRMQVALSRLAIGAAIADVAADVGYRTASAFTVAFKRSTGVLPSDVGGCRAAGSFVLR